MLKLAEVPDVARNNLKTLWKNPNCEEDTPGGGVSSKKISQFVPTVCLSVRLNPINVKTTEPIRPKFCAGPYMILGKVYGTSKLEKIFLENICNFLFENTQIRKNPLIFKNNLKWPTFIATVNGGAKRPKILVIQIISPNFYNTNPQVKLSGI